MSDIRGDLIITPHKSFLFLLTLHAMIQWSCENLCQKFLEYIVGTMKCAIYADIKMLLKLPRTITNQLANKKSLHWNFPISIAGINRNSEISSMYC